MQKYLAHMKYIIAGRFYFRSAHSTETRRSRSMVISFPPETAEKNDNPSVFSVPRAKRVVYPARQAWQAFCASAGP